ncbi:MAG: hypothetical protein MHM6MM_003590 [Cercozoa sp. M6MM]
MAFNACLLTLYSLHLYWFSLIVLAALRANATGAVEDVRERLQDTDSPPRKLD